MKQVPTRLLRAACWTIALGASLCAQGFKLSAPLGPSETAIDFLVAPDGNRVVYRTSAPPGTGLYAVASTGERVATTLCAPGSAYVWDYRIDPRGERVVFRGSVAGVTELYSVPITGGSAVKLNGPLNSGSVRNDLELSPDGARVVYIARQDSSAFEVFVAPIDGSQPAQKLNGPLVQFGEVDRALVSPDGARVIYLADQDSFTINELFTVPIDGSLAPVKISPTLAGTHRVQNSIQLAPGGARVVFVVDLELLYSAPIDGSGPPVLLVPGILPDRNIVRFEISGDGSRVVFLADAEQYHHYELYSVPIDGSALPVNISAPLPWSFFTQAVTPDGTRVVFRDGGLPAVLYSVPIDGSAPPVLLTPSGSASDLRPFVFDKDSSRVVYRADSDASDVFELYSVPVDGSQAPVKLHPSLLAGSLRDVFDFELAPDCRSVLYRANQDSPVQLELYRVPIDGSGPPDQVNAELVLHGHVGIVDPAGSSGGDPIVPGSFYQFGAGGEVVYLADQDTDQTYEIYASFATRPDRRAEPPSSTVTVRR